MLPSIWQEYNKAGNTGVFEDWLKRVLERPRPQDVIDRVHRRHDQGMLVRRWAEAAGPENVTVVVLDPEDHGFVFEVFERMLGLPVGLFESGGLSRSNRSLTVPELELFRQTNRIIRDHDVAWRFYQRYVANGAALRMLQARRPVEGEQRLTLPAWAVDTVVDDQQRHVREIAESGVRVVGNLQQLAREPRVRPEGEPAHTEVTTVPIDAAAEALAGMLSQAIDRSWDFSDPRPKSDRTRREVIESLTWRELADELQLRARQRARRTLRRGR
jgi:hypothetical protein